MPKKLSDKPSSTPTKNEQTQNVVSHSGSSGQNFPDYKKKAVADLIPYVRNARTHSEQQVAQIAASIKEFGFVSPVVIDGDSGIIAGHGRVLAAQKLGLKELPCVEVAWLTESQKRAYVIADNRLAELAGWDDDLLKIELTDLMDADFDLGLTGFSDDDVAAFLAEPTAGLTDPDDVPKLQENVVSSFGDVWLLGSHRLVCGDCTDEETVALALSGVSPALMVTDPPYGVNYDPEWRQRRNLGGTVAKGKVENDDRADWREAWALFPGSVAYVWHGALHSAEVAESLTTSGFELRCQIVWAKTSPVIGRGNYHWQHEVCFYAVKRGGRSQWNGSRKESTLWSIEHRRSESGHGTQKPVEAMRRPIENNSSPGQAVYDPFCGSGTTIVACEMTGRSCIAIEIKPEYVDVAIRRWQDFTGQEAIRERDLFSFSQLEAED